MYNVKNGNVYNKYTVNENEVEMCIGSEEYDEPITNEAGEVTGTKHYKFDLDEGVYKKC